MDLLTFVGIVFGSFAIILGQFLEGGHIGSLVNGPALLIVLGGTIGAVMIETPFCVFKRSMKIIIWIFLPPKIDLQGQIDKLVTWSYVARQQGLLSLESAMELEEDELAKKGLSLLVDGGGANIIRTVLKLELENKMDYELQAAKVFESMGGYAPTIGIIGAVLGLIHVMNNLSDPGKLGSGIAVAFVATIYGVGMANLFLLPLANKLHQIIINQNKYGEMLIEGLVGISEGENPKLIELKLKGYNK